MEHFFHSPLYALIAPALVLLTHIAAVTPTKTDNVFVGCLRAVLDVLAGNYGYAKNKLE